MEVALAKIEEKIVELGGEMSVKMKVSRPPPSLPPSSGWRVHDADVCLDGPCSQPKAVSEAEDLELAALMAKVERENAEVSGDEDGEESEED